MIKKIFLFSKHPISINIILNTIGNYLNVFFTALFAFFLVRILSPVEYGTLSVLLGIAYTLANVLDFGVSASLYSYLPPLLEKKTEKIYAFLKTALFYQTAFSFITVTLLFIFFPMIDRYFLKTNAPVWELFLTTFSVLFLIWQNYASNSLLAAKRVFQATFFLNASNIAKTLLLFILFYFKKTNISTIIFTFGIFGPLVYFLFLFFGKKYVIRQIIKAQIKKEELKLSYTFVYFLASQFSNFGTRIDLFLLSYFFPKTALLGYYGLSSKIILTLFAAISSVTQVLSPHFSLVKEKKELIKLLKRSFLYLLLPTFLFILLILTPSFIFKLAFTEKFNQTAKITKALAFSYLFLPLSNIPYLYFLYTKKNPQKILIANIIFFLIAFLGNYFLIPIKKAFGPPIAIFAAILTSFSYILFLMIKDLKTTFDKPQNKPRENV